jgi:metal-dependent amidase/aminoacylase/carboxypeptidase family protein
MFETIQNNVIPASKKVSSYDLRAMNPKNKQSIVNKAKKILEGQGFTVITGAPKSR